MAIAAPVSIVDQVGRTAGLVWNVLDQSGPISLAKLFKAVDAPRDTVLMAAGWLAREEKISIEERGRQRIVSLN